MQAQNSWMAFLIHKRGMELNVCVSSMRMSFGWKDSILKTWHILCKSVRCRVESSCPLLRSGWLTWPPECSRSSVLIFLRLNRELCSFCPALVRGKPAALGSRKLLWGHHSCEEAKGSHMEWQVGERNLARCSCCSHLLPGSRQVNEECVETLYPSSFNVENWGTQPVVRIPAPEIHYCRRAIPDRPRHWNHSV